MERNPKRETVKETVEEQYRKIRDSFVYIYPQRLLEFLTKEVK